MQDKTIILLAFLVGQIAVAGNRPNAVVDPSIRAPDFTLSSPGKLFSDVFGSNLAKSDFETAQQYQARIARARPPGVYFVALPISFVRYVYAAELQRLVVMARQTGSTLTVSYESNDLGKVPMQNAFGAGVDVSMLKARSLTLEVQNPPLSFPKGIVWQEPSDLGRGLWDDIGLGLPVFIPPARAKDVVSKKSYALVVGFTVENLSGASRQKGGVAPTFNAPVGLATDTSKLPVRVVRLAVLDRDSKKVVASWQSGG